MRTACPWPWKLHNDRLAQGGAVFGGGKGGSGGTTYQTQSVSIPPEVRARYDAVNARAEQVAQQPFTPYGGQFVAPLNETQQAGINQIGSASGAYQPYYQAATMALGQGQQAASPYYQQAGGLYSAGLGAMQQGAYAAMPFYGAAAGDISAAQGAAAPYLDLATAASQQGARAVNPGELNIGKFQNPYMSDVVNTTMANLRQQQQAEQNQLMGSQLMRGAFGGDRAGIGAANLAKQQNMASAQVEAGLRSNAYQQALGAAQQQQGLSLGAEQANRAAMSQWGQTAAALGQQAFQQPMAAAQARMGLGQGLYGMGTGLGQGAMAAGQGLAGLGQGIYGMGAQSAQTLAGLGQGSQQAGLAGGQALLGAGTLGQQTQQQLNAAYYNQFLQQQGYPFQVAQFLANIALGTGPLYGSTTTGVTGQPTPFFSDERVKKNIREIGETHDGQPLYAFDYKGEPDGQSHIGLMAQDVEKRDPGAVVETPGGIKAVDYGRALKHAAGGGPVPVPGIGPDADKAVQDLKPKMPGLAPPMRPAFAAGGAPGVDDFTNQLLMQIANPMGGTLPHGSFGKLPGKPGAWSPGVAKSAGLNAPKLSMPSQPQQTGLGQAISTVKGGLGAVDDAEKMVKYGKDAWDWVKKQMPYNGGSDAGTAAYGSAAPTPSDDNPMGPRAYGGRTGYEGGGDVEDENPAIPYGGTTTDDPLEKLTRHQATASKLPTADMNMSTPGGGGKGSDKTASTAMKLAGLGASFIPGVGPAIGAGMNILSGLFADGGSVDINHAKKLIAGIESGGNYSILGPHVPKQGRAHGKYQVMPANIPVWTEEALGRRMTPEEFLKDPQAQERVFEHQFGKYLRQYGNLADAASAWHSGRPLAQARAEGAHDVNMSTEEYVRRIMGGAHPAEARLAEKPRSAGLAPAADDLMDERPTPKMALVDTGSDFELPERFDRFARGGLVPRHGYEGGGDVPPAFNQPLNYNPNILDPDAQHALEEELRTRLTEQAHSTMHSDTPARKPGVAPPLPAPTPVATVPTPAPTATPDATIPQGSADGSSGSPAGAPPPNVTLPPPQNMDPSSPGFFAKNGFFDRNQDWMLAGLGGIGKMLASRSPFLGNAIGEGLAEGASMYPALQFKKQALGIQQQQADTSSMAELMRSYQYMQRIADVERANNNGQVSAATASNLAAIQQKIMEKAGIAGGTAQGQAPATGQPAAPGAQPRVGAPVAGGAGAPTGTGAAPAYPDTPRTPITADYTVTESGVPVDKMNNPAHLRALAASMSTPERMDYYNNLAKRIEETGEVTDIHGNRGIVKGWPEMQRQKLAVVQNQDWQRKEAGASNERGNLLRTYGILEKTLETLDTNPLAPINAQIKENLRAMGFKVPDGANSAAAVQEITKQVAARAAAAGSDLGRSLTQEGSIEAIKSPEANKTILAQLYADLNAAESRYHFIDDKIRRKSTGDMSEWQREWTQANPPQKFLDDAYNKLAVVGATPINDSGAPDLTRMKTGATYILTPDQYERATGQKVGRNVRVKIGEENGQKGFLIQ